jgi:peptidoglycan/LPS O-acetylase OafA/YrhL
VPQGEPGPRQAATHSDFRRLDIQGLRAVAIILVVAFHAGLPVPGGFIGVDVFLVISGFVITGMLMREHRSTGTIRFRGFYARRIKRLFPALAAATTTVALLSVFLGSSLGSQQTAARTGLGATFFTANAVAYGATGYFSPEAAFNPLLHTWTLSVEEQVYLVFPALLLGSWIAGRSLLRSSMRGAALMLALVVALSFSLCLLLSMGWVTISGIGEGRRFAFYASITRVWEFAVGGTLALASPRLRSISPRVAAAVGLGGACAVGAGAFTISSRTLYPGIAILLPVFGAAAMIIAGFHPSTRVPRSLAAKPMVRVGDLSYAWYLWHWPFIVFGAILWPSAPWMLVIIGAISLIPAWLSTTLLEDPIRRNPAIAGRQIVALALVCIVIPTATCLGLGIGARASWGSEAVAGMKDQVVPGHIIYSEPCDVSSPAAEDTPFGIQSCSWNASASGPPVYLVGDSTAAQYSEALIGASDAIGSPLSISTADACFFVGTIVYVAGSKSSGCAHYVADTVAWLDQQEPGVIVLSSSWDVLIDAPFAALDDRGHATAQATTPEAKYDVVVEDLTQIIDNLRGAGHHVIIVLPTPHFAVDPREADTFAEGIVQGAWMPSACPNVVALFDISDCGTTRSLADVDADQSKIDQALAAVAVAGDSMILDLRARICSQGACSTNRGNYWMYRDGYHITVAESAALAPAFADALRQVVQA